MNVAKLQWRVPTRADLPAWARCCAETYAADQSGGIDTAESLDEYCFSSAVYDPDDALFGFDSDGAIAAWVWPRCFGSGGPSTRVMIDGAVHPAWRGFGLGSHLLEHGERRAPEIVERHAPNIEHPAWIDVATYEQHFDRTELFRARGYRPLRWFNELARPLDQPIEDPSPPEGVTIVAFESRYDEATRLAHNAAFRDHWGSSPRTVEEWHAFHVGGPDFRPELALLALDPHGDVVGYSLNEIHPHEFEHVGRREGWIETLGVARKWRGRGVATALLNESMLRFRAEELDVACLGVDSASPTGADRLYASVGFSRFDCFVDWALEIPGRVGPAFPD